MISRFETKSAMVCNTIQTIQNGNNNLFNKPFPGTLKRRQKKEQKDLKAQPRQKKTFQRRFSARNQKGDAIPIKNEKQKKNGKKRNRSRFFLSGERCVNRCFEG
jgi:hypothetical protein